MNACNKIMHCLVNAKKSLKMLTNNLTLTTMATQHFKITDDKYINNVTSVHRLLFNNC